MFIQMHTDKTREIEMCRYTGERQTDRDRQGQTKTDREKQKETERDTHT